MKHTILLGFMGAGKTSIGKKLAKKTGIRFVDTDQMIEEQTGRVIRNIFAEDGEEFFRDLETELLVQLQKEEEPLVIAVGGGLPVREINRRYLKELGKTVYLKADADTLVNRLRGDTTRPKLMGGDLRERILSLMEAREEKYLDAADLVYATDGKSLYQSVRELQTILFMEKTGAE